jgi:hypothetical protein
MTLSKILDNIYIGNIHSIKKDLGFKLVINCSDDLPFPKYECQKIRLPVNDYIESSKHYYNLICETKILELIHYNSDKTILVYCRAGCQRSCALVVIYLVLYKNYTLEDAIKYIHLCRPCAFNGEIRFLETINLCIDNLYIDDFGKLHKK